MKKEPLFKIKKIPLLLSFALFQSILTQQAVAACDDLTPGSNITTTCTGSNLGTVIKAQLGSTNTNINLLTGASFASANPGGGISFSLISVEDASFIENHGSLQITGGPGTGTHRGAAMVGNGSNNYLHNNLGASINVAGAYNDGMAANGSNNTLVNEGNITTGGPNGYGMTAAWGQTIIGADNNQLINKGSVTTTGSDARAMSILGGTGVILNEGSVLATGANSTAVYLQGDNGRIVNKGLIKAQGTGNAEAVFSNTVSSSFTSYIENQLGGQIISLNSDGIRTLNGNTTVVNAGLIQGASNAINMGNGNDTLILQTGSVINGVADGGSGVNNVFLQGSGSATNSFMNYQSLTMEGAKWVWTGSGVFDSVNINSGEFQLDSTLTGTQSTVASGAKLSGTGTLIGDLVNSGIIQPGVGNTNGTLTIQGNYQGNPNSSLQIYSVLGDDSSPTSRLVIDGGTTSGTTSINVANLGGTGAQTKNGILVVQGTNNANMSPTSFTLSKRVVAGIYDYNLYQGAPTDSSDQNWYLRSFSNAVDPLVSPQPLYRPEIGSYLNNQTSSSTMFMHTLYDRQGVTENRSAELQNTKKPNTWVRVVYNKNQSKSMNQSIDMDTDTTLIHLGGELGQWSNNGESRLHLGIMGAYGHSSADAKADITGYKAETNVDGYSIGAYGTWYLNDDNVEQTGLYIDSWLQYGWYRNEVNGNSLGKEKYDSEGLIVSAEAGYAFILGQSNQRTWHLTPQGQIAYNTYKADDHQESNGTLINNSNADGVITRLGVRLSSASKANSHAQPFVEANWWHNSAKNTLDFNGQTVSDDTPSNRYELKVGVQGDIAKNWQLWGHIGGQWGENNYNRYEGMVGVRKTFL